jgi:hypothetical protein
MQTWPTSTRADDESAERHAIQHENDPLPPDSQRNRFLSRLFHPGDGWMDLRAILPEQPARQTFIEVGDHAGVESFVSQYRADRNLYVGVAARQTRKNGKLENCGTVRAVWCDVDFKNTPEDAAREALASFVHPYSMAVRSGGGLHWYWILHPVDLQDCAEDFKRRLRGTALALHGDLGSAEPAHVLRLPGTLNFKYAPAREVTLEND